MLDNTLIIAGATLIAIGVGAIYVPAGVIAAGIFTLYGGILLAKAGK